MSRHCSAPGYPFVLDTIGKMIEDGYSLAVYCDVHGGQGWADLEALASKLGRDYPCGRNDLTPHLPCPDCLADMDIRLHAPRQPDMSGAHRWGTAAVGEPLNRGGDRRS